MRNYFGFILFIPLAIAAAKVASFQSTVSTTAYESTTLACNVTVDAGANDTICAPGVLVPLRGVITGTFLTAEWTPAAGVTNPNNANTTAVVNATTTYTLRVRSLNDQNLVTNGNFSQGNVGFTSEYEFSATDVRPNNRYSVTTNARNVHNTFANCGDRSGNGNIMVVNASGMSNNVWCQTITVRPNTDYIFAAWVASMVTQNPARLQVSINGAPVGTAFQAPAQTCQWREFTANWTSGTGTTAQICIANVNNTAAGNDFALDDISFREICVTTDEVTITVVNLSADWNNPRTLCQSDAPISLNTLLSNNATPSGIWTVNGAQTNILNPSVLSPGNYNVRYRVVAGGCEAQNEQIITINAPASAGVAQAPARICQETGDNIALNTLLSGAPAGGTWRETSVVRSSGNAFNPNAGTFNTAGQAPGAYTFVYQIASPSPCPPAETTVTVFVEAAPVADAGADQELNCVVDMVTIGSARTSTGAGLQYQWTATGGSRILLPNIPLTEVETPDTYILVVTNTDNGCSSSDTVTVTAQITQPQPTVQIKPLTCNQTRNGAIFVTNVANGRAPYEYSLNGGAFTPKNEFISLAPGIYTLRVRDQNGCDTTLRLELAQPEPLVVELQANKSTIVQGDSVRLRLLLSKPESAITSVVWTPDSIGCANCFAATDRPMEQMVYTVRVTDENNCVATDQLIVFVQQIRRVFIPTAFSPNGDGVNDTFYISAAPEVQLVKSFRIANRWGTLVYSRENFLPNDPTLGWDGLFNGQRIPTGVYAYVAELELVSGETIIVAGDVTLVH